MNEIGSMCGLLRAIEMPQQLLATWRVRALEVGGGERWVCVCVCVCVCVSVYVCV